MHLLDKRMLLMILALITCLIPMHGRAETQRAQIIRFLGVTIVGDRQGAVGELVVGWEERADHHGIIVSFFERPRIIQPGYGDCHFVCDRPGGPCGETPDGFLDGEFLGP